MLALTLAIILSEPPSVVWTAVPTGEMIAVECAGDVNGDGTEDVFAASIEGSGHGIMCLDGLTGEIIWSDSTSLPGAVDRDCLRSVPDVDMDGITDLAVALSANNALVLMSGASGDEIWTVLQEYEAVDLQTITGPGPGDAAIIITELVPPYWYNIRARDASDGDQLWLVQPGVTADRFSRTTEEDVSGNGWAEVGYSIDRGTVSDGQAYVVDGYSGGMIGGASAMYMPSMDITSDCGGILAVSNWGDYPVMWYESITTSDTVWSSNDDEMSYHFLQFVPNGSATYIPDILGLKFNNMTLIRGIDGYHDDAYAFSDDIISVEFYCDTPTWFAAVITDMKFHCPELVYSYPASGPSINLPGTGSSDMCLYESDLYPTPLAVVSRTGSGPGVCSICTSWPLGIEEEHEIEGAEPRIRLLSNPCRGSLSIYAEAASDLLIVDLAGRVAYTGMIEKGQQMDVALQPGLYMIIDRKSGLVLGRAMVLSE